jgi:23S rRNA (adenine1618-N6)-methyltransferase
MARPSARASTPTPPLAVAEGLHPRNRHRDRYDFPALIRARPELARLLVPHPIEGQTLNFADLAAVLALNRALLAHHYGVARWDLPPGALCPPIPGRADYLHHVADLLASTAGAPTTANSTADDDKIPRGPDVALLDIGTGASAIYPILGAREYGWRFVGTDIAAPSLAWARDLVAANPALAGLIEFRLQPRPSAIFEGVVRPGETFAASICNPPFHASAAEAAAGTHRKLRNLAAGRSHRTEGQPALNFGGRANELWCEGGEPAFLRRMIAESARRPTLCRWFTTLVSKSAHLPALHEALRVAEASEVRVIAMRHGQKHSRILAWSFAPANSPKQKHAKTV